MKKVLISSYLLPQGFRELSEHFELIMPDKEAFTKEEIISLIPDVDAFIPTFQYKVDNDMIDAASDRLKIISIYGVGFNNMDIHYAARKGIVVTNTPDPVLEPTAEMTMALMLAAARRISECDRKLRTENSIKWGLLENLGVSLYGKTLGIVGMGRIGKSVARRAIANGMNVIYHNRKPLSIDTEQFLNVRYTDLETLLKTSDVISLHTPLSPDTYHLINEERIKLMKPDAILVNTARGSVIDEKALTAALTTQSIKAAALDVFEFEPNITQELLSLDNVVLAPHNGTATIDARNDMSRFASQNIIRFFEGRTDITRVN